MVRNRSWRSDDENACAHAISSLLAGMSEPTRNAVLADVAVHSDIETWQEIKSVVIDDEIDGKQYRK